MSVKVTTETKILDKIVSQINPRAEQAVKDTAFMVQAKSAIAAPYETGALSASMTAEQEGTFQWIVRDGVTYGIFNELGTYKMGAHPFLTPAVESERQPMVERMKKVVTP